MAKKPTKKELTKWVKKLNKQKLADEIDTKLKVDDMLEEFISTIEDLDDEGKSGEIDDKVLDFYETQIEEEDDEDDEEEDDEADEEEDDEEEDDEADEEEDDEEDDEADEEEDDEADEEEDDEEEDDEEDEEEDDEEDLSALKVKELKAIAKKEKVKLSAKAKKLKGKKLKAALIEAITAGRSDADEEEDEEEEETGDAFDDMDRKALKVFIKKAKAKKVKAITVKKSMSDDDIREAIRAAGGKPPKAAAKEGRKGQTSFQTSGDKPITQCISEAIKKYKGKKVDISKLAGTANQIRVKAGGKDSKSTCGYYVKFAIKVLEPLGHAKVSGKKVTFK